MEKTNRLAIELKELVNMSVTLLGEVIQEECGEKVFFEVEEIRKQMVEYRKLNLEKRENSLALLYEKILKLNSVSKEQVAQSFTLMMELINSCEAAFRTFKLRVTKESVEYSRLDSSIVYVLTAHPTEARSPSNILIFSRIQDLLLRILECSNEVKYLKSIIKHNLKLLWLLPVTRHEKPSVLDEAKHLFSIILRGDIFDTILMANRDLGTIRVRTWVGGDKDGHPGIDEKIMIDCLNLSRSFFIKHIDEILKKLKDDISLIDRPLLLNSVVHFQKNLGKVKKIKAKDSHEINKLRISIQNLDEQYLKIVGSHSPRILKLLEVFEIFPALVIPIELREDSEVIKQALTAKKPIAIERMLKKLALIASGDKVRSYAQGLIISMCQSYSDVENAHKLIKKTLKSINIPVIPLFETADALEDSQKIVNEILKNKSYILKVKKSWQGRFEVMLGYSDSSKGMGVLPSRISIAKTMMNLDKIISQNELTPVFFHGSGGSVDRGGGSIQDQTSWWPSSALNIYKATIQGEMIERSFNTSEIAISGMRKIFKNFKSSTIKQKKIIFSKNLNDFSNLVAKNYKLQIEDEDFFQMVSKATPYSYLKLLKLGSRPSKRSTSNLNKLDFSAIRAIPWILCWTQTRILFPTWWGIGAAWRVYKIDDELKNKLKSDYKNNQLFSTYVRTLGFTLSKVDLAVFKLYLDKSELTDNLKKSLYKKFLAEFLEAQDFYKSITGYEEFLLDKLWLKESIELRSSMIHPLNVIQIQATISLNENLIRKSVTGISSGMMTTG